MGEHIVDITIIGGGPTGLAAAYYGAHRDASVRIVESLEQLGGQVAAVYPEKHIFDVAGYPKVNGQELIDRLTEQAMQYEPEVRLGEVIESISHRDDDVIELHTEAGETLLTRTMIITAGHGAFNPRKLDLPDLERWEGNGLHYFVKKKDVFAGKRVALVGASPGGFGTVLSQNAWLPILRTLGCELWSGGRLLVSRAGTVFDANGALVDAKVAEALRAYLAGYVAWIEDASGAERKTGPAGP